MAERSTISSDYRALQRDLHSRIPGYGSASLGYAAKVKMLMDQIGARSLSDYGAGKGRLHLALQELGLRGYEYFPYDQAFPEYGPPKPADLVCCIDVLEHIEIDYLEAVLNDLKAITRNLGFVSIATGPAGKVLADGRNAHLIQQPKSWWLPRLCEYFEVVKVRRSWRPNPATFWVVVKPRQTSPAATSATSSRGDDS